MTRQLSYWEARAGLAATPILPGLPDRVDIVIAGGGLMAHWLAYFLTLDEPRPTVLVVERDGIGYGASTRNAGFLSGGNVSEWLMEVRDQGEDEALHNFAARRTGVDIVLDHLGPSLALDRCGSADFDPDSDDVASVARRLNRFATDEGLSAGFERRRLRLGSRERHVWFTPDDYAVDPVEILLRLRDLAEGRGVRFAFGLPVVAIADGTAIVATSAGERSVAYRHGFVCTNGFATDLDPGSPVRPARGQILVTEPCTVPTSPVLGFLNEGHDYFRMVDGRLLVGGGRHLFVEDEYSNRLTTTADVQAHLEELARRLTDSADVAVERRWAGIMGMPSGSHGSVRRLEQPNLLDDRTESLSGLGGWGMSLTPYVAERRAAALG